MVRWTHDVISDDRKGPKGKELGNKFEGADTHGVYVRYNWHF